MTSKDFRDEIMVKQANLIESTIGPHHEMLSELDKTRMTLTYGVMAMVEQVATGIEHQNVLLERIETQLERGASST